MYNCRKITVIPEKKIFISKYLRYHLMQKLKLISSMQCIVQIATWILQILKKNSNLLTDQSTISMWIYLKL